MQKSGTLSAAKLVMARNQDSTNPSKIHYSSSSNGVYRKSSRSRYSNWHALVNKYAGVALKSAWSQLNTPDLSMLAYKASVWQLSNISQMYTLLKKIRATQRTLK